MAKAQPALLLAIDCSNTGIKFGLYPYESDELRARWRVATVREKTVDGDDGAAGAKPVPRR